MHRPTVHLRWVCLCIITAPAAVPRGGNINARRAPDANRTAALNRMSGTVRWPKITRQPHPRRPGLPPTDPPPPRCTACTSARLTASCRSRRSTGPQGRAKWAGGSANKWCESQRAALLQALRTARASWKADALPLPSCLLAVTPTDAWRPGSPPPPSSRPRPASPRAA